MKSVVLTLLAAAACLCLSNSIHANTFYVATSGHDSNAGTLTQPWLTLQHAVDTINHGDTILIESGTYVGCRIGNSGQAAGLCTLKADTGASVLINAPGPANRHNSNIEVELFGETVSYWVIDGLESANSPLYGIDLRVTQFITVQNCFTHGSALTGIFLAFCDHPLIQNNETSFNGEHGIYDSNSGDFPTIRANRSHDNQGSGIHMNGDRTQTPGDGIISFGLIEKNIIYANGAGGGSGINCDGVSDSTFRNNLVYNNHASGISLYAIDGAEGSSRNLVYNNTIVMASGSRWCVNIPASTEGQPNPTGNQVKNNILYTPDAGHGSVTIYAAGVSGFESDYNIVVATFSDDNDNTTIPLSSWQALGYDTHSIVATPANLFIDPPNSNYHLKSGSPAIGAGTALAQVTDDLDGITRPAVSPASGCYQAAVGGNRLQGFVDAAGCNTISGWAWDGLQTSATMNVDIYNGSTLIAASVPANRYRVDLLNVFGSPSHGFSYPTPLALRDGASHTINIYYAGTKTPVGGSPKTLGCNEASQSLVGALDGVGCDGVSGWAEDSNDRAGVVNVDIYADSTLIATLVATQVRPDLTQAGFGNPYHGFTYPMPSNLKDGKMHTITVKFGGTTTNLPWGTNPLNFTCTGGTTPSYQGSLDPVNCTQITGIAWDVNSAGSTIDVAIYLDGSFQVVIPAQQSSPGVGGGFHGFIFPVPTTWKGNVPHSVTVKISGTNQALSNTPQLLTCP